MNENTKNMSDPTATGEFKEIKMRKRSTTEVKSLLKYANDELKRKDEFATKEFKMGICNMIEFILFETGNYRGYSYLDNTDIELHSDGYWNRQYH